MSLASLTRPDLILTDLQAADRPQVLHELADRLARSGVIRSAEELFRDLWEREQQGSTGIGGGVAIPHCKLRSLRDVVVALATTAVPVEFGAPDGRPIDLIVLVASPADAPAAHLQALARISRLLRTPGFAAALRSAHSNEELVAILRTVESGQPVSR